MRRSILGLAILGLLAGAPVLADITVRGTVTTADGGALGRAHVELLPVLDGFESGKWILATGRLEPEPAAQASSGPDGRFRLAVPRDGMWRLVVRAEGFVPMQFPPVVLLASRELGQVVLHRDRPTSVRVSDPAGKPLAGAWVWVAGTPPSVREAGATGWQADYRAARSGDDGRVVVSRAARETSESIVLAAGYVPHGPAELAGEVRLEPGSVLRPVRVVDPRGAGAAGVLVRVGELSWPLGLTGPDGDARVPVRGGEATDIVLTTADGRQQSAAVPAGPEPWSVVLEDGMPVSGRVLDDAGRPLAGAVLWSGSDLGRLVRTGAEGRYRLVAPGRSRFWIQAEAPGFVPRTIRITPDQIAAGRAPTVALARQTALAGVVSDVAGRPVAGAQVEAVLVQRGGRRPFFSPDPADSRSWSGRQGRFELVGLTPGRRYELRARRRGFTPAETVARAGEGAEDSAGVRLVLTPVRGAFGRVVDGQERPVAGAAVRLTVAGRRPPARMTPAGDDGGPEDPFGSRSDESGHFEVAEVPAQTVDLSVHKRGFTPVLVRGLRLPPEAAAFDLGTVVLVPGSRLTGRVLDHAGEGVEGASVHVLRELESPRRLGSVIAQQIAAGTPDATTGADGHFAVEGLVAGRQVHLFVHRSGYASGWLEHVDVPRQEPVRLVLEPGFRVAGRVTDEAGTPVEGARVHVEWRRTLDATEIPVGPAQQRLGQTDGEGSFVIADLRPGKATLHVLARGFVVPAPIELEVGADGDDDFHDVTVTRGAVLAGRITTVDGEAVAGARVGAGESAAFSDAEGVYRVEGVALGPASVEVFHPHFELASREIEVKPGINELDVTFRTGHEVSGRVIDADGQLLAGAFVELAYDGRRAPRKYRARSLGDGSFRLPSVVDGEYRLSAGKEGYATAEVPRPVRVAGTPVEDLEVVLERGVAIVGQVLGLDFDQLAQVSVRAEGSRGRSRPGSVDYRGGYEIRELGSGDWLVRAVLAGGGRQVQARLTLAPGAGEVRRDLEFEDNLTLSGRVIYHGAPLPGTLVSLRGYRLAVERLVRTNHQGEFRIEDLVEGTYRLGLMNERELVVHNQDVELATSRELVLDVSSGKAAGTVRRAADGQGVDRALVVLRRVAATPGGENMLTAGTGPEGAFEFPRVPKGEYRLTVRKDGYTSEELFLDLTAGGEERGLEVLLTATAGLEVLARFDSGRVPTHVTVAVLDAAGQAFLRESRPVDENGRAWLATVPSGRWQLLITAPGAVAASLTVEVPGEPVPVTLTAAGRLAVRVGGLAESDLIATLSLFGGDGRPFRGLDVAEGLRDSWRLIGGRGAVAGVPPGVWTVHVVDADGRLYTGSALVRAGSETEMVLE